MNKIRNSDLPEHKEKIISQLFGEFIGFLKTNGLTKGAEYETKIEEVFQCSRKIIWIDECHKNFQITVYLNSIQMFVEFGVVNKKTKEIIHRNKIENLRYKISCETQIELIDSHQKLFNELFEDFTKEFNKLKNVSIKN